MKSKHIILFFALLSISFRGLAYQCSHKNTRGQLRSSASDNLRSDSVDVLNYTITLDISDYVNHTISGNCAIRFTPKVNGITVLPLDLLAMNIDSITLSGSTLSYSYNDTLLIVTLPAAMNPSDTAVVIVYYNGIPQMDPSGWGGWYRPIGYTFNLGVGFGSLPHNYGRVWHPCFDNFVEHASYDFIITTGSSRKAYCNGLLVNETTSGGFITRHWQLDDPIPSYLASVAVAAYTHVEWNYVSSLTGLSTPVWLISLPSDTTAFKNTFTNIFSAIEAFETRFGPHFWNKVGYVAVPFGSGAMEHATNIAFPLVVVQSGSLQYETLMAHELAHHWWGDLVTCKTAEHMWINEGMASYAEKLFLEYMYDELAYFDEVRTNHKSVLWKAHVDDGAYYAIGAVPESVTYGSHSYNKGSDVVHTMRTYLGDSLFFVGLKYIIANNQLQNIDSYDFRDQLMTATGIDLTDFFDNWVMNPGFPHFSIDSMSVVPSAGDYDVTIYVKQKLKAAPSYYSGVPLQVTFRDQSWNVHTENIVVSGANSSFTFTVPINPVYTALNEDEKISDAITAQNMVITTPGIKQVTHANFQLTVASVTDSVFLRVEHNWVAADAFINSNFLITLTPDRYWRILGVDNDKMSTTGKFTYNGTTGGAGYLDNGLMINHGSVLFHEDSLVLLYRSSLASDWTEYPYYQLQTQASKTDKIGAVVIDSLQLGDYALGIKTSSVGISEKIKNRRLKTYPNPAKDSFRIETDLPEGRIYNLEIRDMNGRIIKTVPSVSEQSQIPIFGITPGTYYIFITDGKNFVASAPLIIQ
jgi:hypothetical protein